MQGESHGEDGGVVGAAKKVGALLLGGRVSLTTAVTRHMAIELIGEANAAGARLANACAEIGLSLWTLKRWRKPLAGDGDGQDRRKGVHAWWVTG